MYRIALLLLLLAGPCWPSEPLRIAVAANFKPTLEKISARFQAESGHRILLSSASTGVLYNQVTHGAPFDLLFAADRRTPMRLQQDGIGKGAPFCYAIGRLVLTGGDLAQLADPGQSVAIANPATAPYGSAALEVLARNEFSPGKSRKLVRGNNVAQAYQFWHSGAVDMAMVARSLAPHGTPIPGEWHRPLEQYATVLKHSTAVDAYLNWIRSDTVRSVMIDAGYQPCP